MTPLQLNAGSFEVTWSPTFSEVAGDVFSVGATTDAALRRYAFEVLGGHVKCPAFVLVTDANQEELATVERSAEILDDDALPAESRELRGHVVADLQRTGRGCPSARHCLEGSTGERLATGWSRSFRPDWRLQITLLWGRRRRTGVLSRRYCPLLLLSCTLDAWRLSPR